MRLTFVYVCARAVLRPLHFFDIAPTSLSVSIIKVSRRVHSDAFKTGLGFLFTVIIST